MRPDATATAPVPVSEEATVWNLPNLLCTVRLLGAPVLVGIALFGRADIFFWLMLVLLVTDWLDGKLAVWLRQQSSFGARLDSVADASLYAALLFGAFWLKWDFVVAEAPWLLVGVGSYGATCLLGLAKFGRLPSYHTRMAKISWLLITVAVIVTFGGGGGWALRVAMVSVTLTNLETMAMTWVLNEWHSDMLSLQHALRRRGAGRGR